MTPKTVTIIGASGRLGRLLSRRLMSRGFSVVAVTSKPAALDPVFQSNARYIDYSQAETFQAIFTDAELVVSCIHGKHGVALLKAMPKTVERIVLIGSTHIYTRHPDAIVAELQASVDALAQSGIPGVMLHPTMTYGADDKNLHRIAAYIRRFGIIPLPTGGRALLQPIHIDDVVSCIDAALTRDTAPGPPIVIAGDTQISYRDLILKIGTIIGRRPLILPMPGKLLEKIAPLTKKVTFVPTIRPDEVRRLNEAKVFPIDEMVERLGVTPTPLEQGLQKAFP